jgi:3-hydroxybutyryl-CoA dehydratase
VHLNEDFANDTIFKRKIVHGFLYGSLINAVIGTKLPGPGIIYMQQTMKFFKPVFVGETITTIITVKNLNANKGTALLETKCLRDSGEEIIAGEALVKLGYMANRIHKTAIIYKNVELGDNNEIGADTIIKWPTTIGDDNIIMPHVVIGEFGHDTKNPRYNASNAKIEIGSRNTIREFCWSTKTMLERCYSAW